MGQGLVAPGFRTFDTGRHPAEIQCVPGQPRQQQPGAAVLARQVPGIGRRERQVAHQAELGKPVGGFLADLRVAGSQLALGHPDIRACFQDRRRVGKWHLARDSGQGAGSVEARVQLARFQAAEQVQLVNRLDD